MTTPDLAQIVENLADEIDTLQESIGSGSSGTWATWAGADWVSTLSFQTTTHTRGLLTEVTRLTRTSAIMNPLLRRAMSLRAAYIWGSGVSITAVAQGGDGQDVNAVVQGFLDTPGNQLVEDLTEPVNERSLATDGNVFFAHFTNPVTGAVSRSPRSSPTPRTPPSPGTTCASGPSPRSTPTAGSEPISGTPTTRRSGTGRRCGRRNSRGRPRPPTTCTGTPPCCTWR